jgi:1,4-alpha-glucan branching enzyme
MMKKMPEDDWQKAANLRMFFAWMWAHPGKKLLFQGCEIGQWSEWDHARSVDWHLTAYLAHGGIQYLVKRLNALYRSEEALYLLDDKQDGFQWVDFRDADNTVWSFLRKAPSASASADLLVIVNATPVVRQSYRIGAPGSGYYRVLLNTDALEFGGSGCACAEGWHAEDAGMHGLPHALDITLPPLSVLILSVPTN